MDFVCLAIVLIIGIVVSRRIRHRTVAQHGQLLAGISAKTERLRQLESELQQKISQQQRESTVSHTRHPIDLEKLVLLDRSVVYMKRSVQTYYDVNSGNIFAFSSPATMLVSNKLEIEHQDLIRFFAAESSRAQKEPEEAKIKDYRNVIPFRRSA